jgi:hypothetical protein
VKDCWHRRISRGVSVALTAIWMVSVVAAGAAVTPAMHCHGINMPCCPPSGSESARCSGTQCVEQIPQKSEATAKAPVVQAATPVESIAVRVATAPARELTAGYRFPSPVFRFKDDFRI